MSETEMVQRAVEHVKAVQERCGTRLVQLNKGTPVSSFDEGDVDIEFLVRDILAAAQTKPETSHDE